MFTIYMIVGPTGKYYIGQTRLPLTIRWQTHVSRALGTAKNQCKHLASAIRKYGPAEFVIQALMIVETKEQANTREKALIQALNARDSRVGYNLTAGGDGALGIRGHKLSKDHKKKLSIAKMGNKINLGRKHSPERRAIESAAHMGHHHSQEAKDKNRASHLGRTYKKRRPMSIEDRKKRQDRMFLKTIAYG